MRLDGKVALITGGGTGIGAAIARRLVADGARICITGRRQEKLDQTASKLPAGSVVTCSGDVSIPEDVDRMIQTAVKIGGRLDVLVNNAAMDHHGPIIEMDNKRWKEVFDVNLNGPFMLMKAAIPYMLKVGGGSIINIASLAGLRCMPGSPAYCSSKAGLIMLTQQVALEYGPSSVRCNVICPGAVKTEAIEKLVAPLTAKLNTNLDGVLTYFAADVPLRRAAFPDEISGVCSFLAGSDSSFMTGAVLVVDGGAAIVDVSGVTISKAMV
jgi:NAD(P)-dependent dehydrogenase (short-subunit alcohol dehydrogenase family)